MIRLALAGGSDERPPHDEPRNAQIIRFPIERRVQSQGKPPIDRSPDDGRHGVQRPPRIGESSCQQWPRIFRGH